jgi:hypothetical protein
VKRIARATMQRSSPRPDCRAAIVPTTARAKEWIQEWIPAARMHCRALGFQLYPLLPLRDAPAR